MSAILLTVVRVVVVAVERDVHPLRDQLRLLPQRRGELSTVVSCTRRFRSGITDETIELLFHRTVLRTLQPDFVPVLALAETTADDVDHVLGRVDGILTGCSVSTEVLLQRAGVVSDIAEVDRFATSREEQKSVELGKETGGGLMNGD